MLYTVMNVKEKELKLRLNANMCVQVEKQIGKNPVNAILGVKEDEMPKLTDLLTILWGALQPLNRGYTMPKVWELYDEYISEGNSMADLMVVILDVFKVSGFVKDEDPEESDAEEEKNV